MNRLAKESSPYLRQHAANPVDWYPWGDEALRLAVERNWPIFLSIGYSACHWCHVMEHESFSDPATAELMNRNFINIKIDREERPDLDQIYMNSVMALTGRGGWPMSVFLTPQLNPFYCGTYWPPEPRRNMPGFRQILTGLRDAWDERREDINNNADQLAKAVVRLSQPQGEPRRPDAAMLKAAENTLLEAFDRCHGGFGTPPKFLHPMDLRVLMRCWRMHGSKAALEAVKISCDRMAAGGIYDHLGGGFHRYSTDEKWLVPHFEKMLYDNALLTTVYTELIQITNDAHSHRVVRETLDYILREMTIPEGGFCSAQDADSEGEEGRFFVWDHDDVLRALGESQAELFSAAYDITAQGNWEGRNILNRPYPLDEIAAGRGITVKELMESLNRSKQILFSLRSRRIAPRTDDKIITAWNGMLIAGMATAARTLGDERYFKAADTAANYILTVMTVGGRLMHTARHHKVSIPAFLDDYACLIDGLIELYQSGFDEVRIQQALLLADRLVSDFADRDNEGFFFTSADQVTPVTRLKDSQDGATPSGNAMAATALLKLGALTGRADLLDKAESTLQLMDGQLHRSPMSGGQSLIAIDHLLGPGVVVVIQSKSANPAESGMLSQLRSRFAPGLLVCWRGASHDADDDSALAQLYAGRTAITSAGETAWVCERGRCFSPVTTPNDLAAALDTLLPQRQP